jgi:type VI secretion system protein ImpC
MADQPENTLPTAEPVSRTSDMTPVTGAALLNDIISKGKMVRGNLADAENAQLMTKSTEMLEEFGKQINANDSFRNAVIKGDLIDAIEDRIASIDGEISVQLNAIMHSPEFQALEASWRGLNYLVMNAETGDDLKIRLLNATKKELRKDIEKATEFDQSSLFKKIYEEEYGTYGGYPYSCLVGDYYFDAGAQDLALLQGIAGVAAAAHAPFITAASPALFNWSEFGEMNNRRDLAKGFSATELAPWNTFRESEDSRYVAMVVPRMLLRLPYDPVNKPVEEFGFNEFRIVYETDSEGKPAGKDGRPLKKGEQRIFKEDVDSKDSSKYLWGNGAYALAERITNAFSHYHWCAAIRGVEGGGKVEGLPFHTFKTDDGDVALKCPTEISITDRREKELNDLGFISLCHCKGQNYAVFFGGQTTNKPLKYITDSATANARLSSALPYVLAASRFAHYLKVIMRDKIGSFMTGQNVANYLNQWIAQYVLLDDDAPPAVKARFPLREARVDVTDQPGKPGCYNAVVFLKPHFQLDELTVSIRLVAELPPPIK